MLTAPRLELTYASGGLLTVPTPPPTRPAQQNIQDGQYFTVVDGANQTTFEFDTGPEITQAIDVAGDVSIRDGNFFQLDNNIFQMDVGSVVEVFGTGAMVDGAVVTVNDGAISRSFEFQLVQTPSAAADGPQRDADHRGAGTTPLQIASDLATAINASGLNIIAHAPGRRVSMEGDFAVSLSPAPMACAFAARPVPPRSCRASTARKSRMATISTSTAAATSRSSNSTRATR